MGAGTEQNQQTTDWAVFGGDHKISKPDTNAGFLWSEQEEPHASRRKQIMAKYGKQLKPLFGHEWRTKYVIMLFVSMQLGLAYYVRDMAWTWQFWVLAYVFGATFTQNVFLAIHETSHNLTFKDPLHNKLFSILVNLPIGIPYSAKFKPYHMEHHKYQGVDGVDTDVPTKIETMLFTNVLGKTFFCFTQILFYALRPMMVRHQVLNGLYVLNAAVQLSFNYAVVHYCGWGPIYFFLVSDFLAGSLHPMASHFIAEHYVFCGEQETYSYYGPLNILAYNVGYHNEHHDFPNIPWTRLPQLRAIASDFYDNIPQHKSWPLVIWQFIMDPNVSSKNRVKRADKYGVAKVPIGAARKRQ